MECRSLVPDEGWARRDGGAPFPRAISRTPRASLRSPSRSARDYREEFNRDAAGNLSGVVTVSKAEYGKYGTSVPGVFAADDVRRGQSLVVWPSTKAAGPRECDRWLMGQRNCPDQEENVRRHAPCRPFNDVKEDA
jgi:glutamate synthase (NADPH) small chain